MISIRRKMRNLEIIEVATLDSDRTAVPCFHHHHYSGPPERFCLGLNRRDTGIIVRYCR